MILPFRRFEFFFFFEAVFFCFYFFFVVGLFFFFIFICFGLARSRCSSLILVFCDFSFGQELCILLRLFFFASSFCPYSRVRGGWCAPRLASVLSRGLTCGARFAGGLGVPSFEDRRFIMVAVAARCLAGEGGFGTGMCDGGSGVAAVKDDSVRSELDKLGCICAIRWLRLRVVSSARRPGDMCRGSMGGGARSLLGRLV